MEYIEKFSEFILDKLLSKYGNDFIHSAEIIQEKIKNPYDEITVIRPKKNKKSRVEKGFLGIPKTVTYEETVDEEVIEKSLSTYSFSYERIKSILESEEKIVFSINGGIYFTNKRVIFYSYPLYKAKNPPRSRGFYKALSIVEIIKFYEKGKTLQINGDFEGGKFLSEKHKGNSQFFYWKLNYSSLESDLKSPDVSDFYDTNNFIYFGILPYLKEYWYDGSWCSHIKFPNNNYAEIGDFLNDCIDQYLLQQVKTVKNSIITELDTDNNGKVDLIENNDYLTLLNKYQKQIIDIDRTYIHKFVKIGTYLKTKKENIQLIFDSIKASISFSVNEEIPLLKNQVHTYNLVFFHSLNMIKALADNNMIVFFEIYESFDKLGIFNSNWENEVSQKLSDIGTGLMELMYTIDRMENNIVNEISNLSYVTQESFRELNSSLSSELREIGSSINVNNLFTVIQSYQLYKINKNTKKLN